MQDGEVKDSSKQQEHGLTGSCKISLDGTASSPAGLVGSVYATRTSGDNELLVVKDR